MKLYSTAEAAEYISKVKYISERMVRHYANPKINGILKGSLVGNSWTFTKKQLDTFIKKYAN